MTEGRGLTSKHLDGCCLIDPHIVPLDCETPDYDRQPITGRTPSRWAVVFDVFDPTPEQRDELFHAAVLFSVEMEQRLGIEIGVTGQPHEELGT